MSILTNAKAWLLVTALAVIVEIGMVFTK